MKVSEQIDKKIEEEKKRDYHTGCCSITGDICQVENKCRWCRVARYYKEATKTVVWLRDKEYKCKCGHIISTKVEKIQDKINELFEHMEHGGIEPVEKWWECGECGEKRKNGHGWLCEKCYEKKIPHPNDSMEGTP